MSILHVCINLLASTIEETKTQEISGEREDMENVQFTSEVDGGMSSFSYRLDPSYGQSMHTGIAEYKDYLGRPVKIFEKKWNDNTTLTNILANRFEPWNLFFTNTAMNRKASNFYLVKCELKLKVLVNASPFYYGKAALKYRPLLYTDAGGGDLSADDGALCALSQRQGIDIYPGENRAGEMILPFYYPRDWLNVTSASDLTNMGRCYLYSYTDLLNANGIAGTGASIVVYAQAINIELAAPTKDLAAQSEEVHDEYTDHDGFISKPASAVARFAGGLSDLPIIGEYATATSIIARGIGTVASWFGFSNTPVIKDVVPYKSMPFHSFASPEISAPVEKLTLDPKNELTIDNSVCGLTNEDPLLIKNLVTREAFLKRFSWAPTDAKDTALFTTQVLPDLKRSVALTIGSYSGYQVWESPMSHFSKLFTYWRGDIIFRFEMIKSKFHKGRVRITWDPIGDIRADPDTQTTNMTKVIDIDQCDESFDGSNFEIVVPYSQEGAYLRTAGFTEEERFGSTTCPARNAKFDNGYLQVRVETELTSADATAPVEMLVHVRAGDNMEFMAPEDLKLDHTYYQPQSEEISDPAFINTGGYFHPQSEDVIRSDPLNPDEESMLKMATKTHPAINLIHGGELCLSLRQLLRRTSLSRVTTLPDDTTSNFMRFSTTIDRLPLYYGYDSNGINTADSTVSPGTTESFNFVNNVPINHVIPCFVSSRGAVVWHINVDSPNYINSLVGKRGPDEVRTVANYYKSQGVAFTSDGQMQRDVLIANGSPGASGMSLQNQKTQTGLSVHYPFYSRYRFYTNGISDRTLGITFDDSDVSSLEISCTVKPAFEGSGRQNNMYQYCSIGTDFQVQYFLNVPPLYTLPSVPAYRA